jgi:dimethylglycine dehydrogenase
MRTEARVVVIGGGAMGCSLLYHLTRLGWSDVMLVEKNELTAGSTWHAAGLCTHFAHNLTIMNLRAHSVRLYQSLEAETGQPVSFHASGALRITRSPERMDEFRQVQGLGRFAGFDFHILTPAELKDIYPLAETEDLLGAIYEPLDGHVDPSQATNAMAKGARQAGAEISRHNPVEAIERKPSGAWLVRTKNGDITAEIIVNAAGTWCREIGAMMGLDLPVVPILHQYLVTDRVEEVAARDTELPIIRDPEESWYLRQERDGFICGPYERDANPWSVDGVPADFGMELLPPELERIEDIVAAAMERVPAFAEAGIKTIVNGPITFTPDANPLIGPAFDLDNAYLLTGSSMGVMEGGGAGKLLAEWIVDGEPPMDALAVDPRRFGGYADRGYRLAKAVESFGKQFAIHYPFEERPAGRPGIKTPAYDAMDAAGAVFGAVYGWERPNWFARPADHRGPRDTREAVLSFRRTNWFEGVGEECAAVRDRVALADLSAFSKVEASGQDAPAFLEGLGANRPPRRIGGIGLTHVLAPGGGVLSEFAVTRTGEDRYYLVSAGAAERWDLDLLRSRATPFARLAIDDVKQALGVLAVMGPRARDLLAALSDDDLGNAAFPWLTAREITVAGVPVLALRVSYVGELGWELHHPMDRQADLFAALLEAGRRFEAGLFGAFAMNALRLEKGYRAWGMDLTSERTPLEAGLDMLVKSEGRDFVGREALLARHGAPDRWSMALLALEDGAPDPFASHTVLQGGRPVGMVTSGAYGHRVGRALALAYFTAAADLAAGDLSLLVLGETVPAEALDRPPYDPDNLRLRDTR